jgi:hypothetical protein
MLPVVHFAVAALAVLRCGRLRRSRFRAGDALGVVESRDLGREDLEDAECDVAREFVGVAYAVAVSANFLRGG